MLLFLTNDDGFDGEGLKVLAEKLSEKHEVWIIAPDRNRSGVSNHFSMDNKLKLTKLGERFYKYEGYPADCTLLATRGYGVVLPRMPDAVVSGINRGANMGTDLVYSGTAAAARQAVINGVPAVAFSVESDDENYYYDNLADFALKNLEKLLSLCDVAPRSLEQKKRCSFINVNAKSSKDPYKGVKLTDTAFREYNDYIQLEKISENESLCCTIGKKTDTSSINYSDYEAVSEGYISVSKICAEVEAYRIVDGISFSM
ncbi:MAG: 5'/3'-nucleotidase SurE [Treponema sp.]|nr:5'/3'-nucleotidase SurE [Treponema sp.]